MEPTTSQVTYKRASSYQIVCEGGLSKSVDLNGNCSVNVDQSWGDEFSMVDPTSDLNCTMKLGASTVSLAQLFTAGTGPLKLHAVNNSKKPGDNIFNQLNALLHVMPNHQHPTTPKLDPNVLEEAEKKVLDSRRKGATDMLEAAKAKSG